MQTFFFNYYFHPLNKSIQLCTTSTTLPNVPIPLAKTLFTFFCHLQPKPTKLGQLTHQFWISPFHVSLSPLSLSLSRVSKPELPIEAAAMRALDVVPVSSPVSNSTLQQDESGGGPKVLYGWLYGCHGFWHNLPLIVFSSMFVLYLASHAKKSFGKLSQRRSYIMISYYGVLWLVSVLNLAWCLLQVRGL